eukprot:scaffold15612_cov57-Cyclotella_meneghiniana.AAC.6
MDRTCIDEVMAVSFYRDQYGFDFESIGDESCFNKTMSTEEHGCQHPGRWIIKEKECEKYDIRLHRNVKGYFYSKNNDSDMETTTYWSGCDELVEVISTMDSHGNTENDNGHTENIMAYSFHRDDYGWEYFQEMSAVGFEELPVEIEGRLLCVNWKKYSTGGVWSKGKKRIVRLDDA